MSASRSGAVLRTRLAGLVAVALAAAAGLLGLGAAPAAAAYCSGGGVNVVVDFQGLGGGVAKGCDPNGGGKTAEKIFGAAGFSLRYAQRQPGFVCRVQNKPGNDPCVNTPPADAYWGLFHSDGRSGRWSYSSSGVGGLKIPEGGFVAFSWQNGGAQDAPGAAPVNQQPSPKPTKSPAPTKPTSKPTKTASPSAGGPSGSVGGKASSSSTPGTTVSETPTASAKAAGKSKRTRASAGASPSKSPSPSSVTLAPTGQDPTPSAEARSQSEAVAPAENDDGLPAWVPILVVLTLASGGAAAAWWRRRAGPA